MDNQPVQSSVSSFGQSPDGYQSQNQLRKSRNTKKLLLFALLILVLLAGTAYAVYAWQQTQVKDANSKADNLQSQLASLQTQVDNLKDKQSESESKSSNSSNAANTTTPAYTEGAKCQSSQLSLALTTQLKSASNQTGAYFSLTNTSKVVCTLKGYPKLTAQDSSGKSSGQAINEGGYMINDPGAQSVTLASGASAYFGVSWALINSDSTQTGCMNAVSVSATPPDTTAALTTTASLSNICRGLYVTAIAPKAAFTTTSP